MPKSTFEKNKEKISAEAEKFADDVKDTAEDIGNRWTRSETEEKITMIVGVVLLTLGLLAVSGFFDRPLRDLIRYCKKEFKTTKTVSSTAKPAEKKTKKDA